MKKISLKMSKTRWLVLSIVICFAFLLLAYLWYITGGELQIKDHKKIIGKTKDEVIKEYGNPQFYFDYRENNYPVQGYNPLPYRRVYETALGFRRGDILLYVYFDEYDRVTFTHLSDKGNKD